MSEPERATSIGSEAHIVDVLTVVQCDINTRLKDARENPPDITDPVAEHIAYALRVAKVVGEGEAVRNVAALLLSSEPLDK